MKQDLWTGMIDNVSLMGLERTYLQVEPLIQRDSVPVRNLNVILGRSEIQFVSRSIEG
jgi:hypothetical protein